VQAVLGLMPREAFTEIGDSYNVSGWTISGFAHTYAKNAHF